MKKNTILFIVVIMALVAFGTFYFLNKKNSSQYTAPLTNETPSQVVPVSTTPTDTAGNPIKGEFGEPAEDQQPVKVSVVEKKVVKGSYFYTEDSKSQYAGKICFRADSTTQGVAKTFCFDNVDEAFAVLDISKGIGDGDRECTTTGSATIEVKNYKKLTGDAGGYDSAILTKLIVAGNQSFLACGEFK